MGGGKGIDGGPIENPFRLFILDLGDIGREARI
jgi:hypothetical protein